MQAANSQILHLVLLLAYTTSESFEVLTVEADILQRPDS